MNKDRKISPYTGFAGITGFAGLSYFWTGESHVLIYFMFFSFFSFFWYAKYRFVKKDERFLLNDSKARSIAGRVTLCVIMGPLLLLHNSISESLELAIKYDILTAVVALGIALYFNVYGFLLHRYETK